MAQIPSCLKRIVFVTTCWFAVTVTVWSGGLDRKLFQAAENLDFPLVKKIVDLGGDPKATLSSFGSALFAVAVLPEDRPVTADEKARRLDIARYLLDHGADLHSRDGGDNTPLNRAAECGFPEMVALLLDFGADPQVHDNSGGTPLHDAVCTSGNLPVVQMLLARGATPNTPDHDRKTPLHLALEFGPRSDPALIKALLEAGADPHLADVHGMTPLLHVLGESYPEKSRESVFKLLLAHGAATRPTPGECEALGSWYMSRRQDTEARRWFQTGIAQGDRSCRLSLGRMLRAGRGGPRDFAGALAQFRAAAKAGCSLAMSEIGKAYLTGEGVARDPIEAWAWFSLAGKHDTDPIGNPWVVEQRELLWRTFRGGQIDTAEKRLRSLQREFPPPPVTRPSDGTFEGSF